MKKVLSIAIIVLIAGLVINYKLDGFSKLEATLVTSEEYILYGQYYEGRYNDDELEALIVSTRDWVQSNKVGELAIVNYFNGEDERRGKIKQFVGVIITDDKQQAWPEDFEILEIKANETIEVKVSIRALVMPSPEKIKNIAIDFADNNNKKLQQMSIERYNDTGFLIVHFPLL